MGVLELLVRNCGDGGLTGVRVELCVVEVFKDVFDGLDSSIPLGFISAWFLYVRDSLRGLSLAS